MRRQLSETELAHIRGLMDGGDKIEAIKAYRAATGAGLANAKQFVEAIAGGADPPTTDVGELSNEQVQQIQAALFSGQKISAIKTYRNASGLGLYEAKQFIEALETELRQTSPEKFTAPPAKGCGAAALVMLAIGIVLVGLAVWIA